MRFVTLSLYKDYFNCPIKKNSVYTREAGVAVTLGDLVLMHLHFNVVYLEGGNVQCR